MAIFKMAQSLPRVSSSKISDSWQNGSTSRGTWPPTWARNPPRWRLELLSPLLKKDSGGRSTPLPDQVGFHWEPPSFTIEKEKHSCSEFGLADCFEDSPVSAAFQRPEIKVQPRDERPKSGGTFELGWLKQWQEICGGREQGVLIGLSAGPQNSKS